MVVYCLSSINILYIKVHKQRLMDKKCYSEEEVEEAVEDGEKYKAINRETPGFFDVAINTGKHL